MTNVKPIPEGFSTVTPNLVVQGGAEAIEFYERAFGAEVVARLEAGGMLMHATLRIGDAVITLSDAMPAHGLVAPDADAGVSVFLTLYVEDADAWHRRALDAGATRDQPGRRPRPRRPRRLAARPVRPPLGDGDAHRGRLPRGDRAAARGVGVTAAAGTFAITAWDAEPPYDAPADGPPLARITVRKAFSGPLEGESEAQLLVCAEAGYLASERVRGDARRAGGDVRPPARRHGRARRLAVHVRERRARLRHRRAGRAARHRADGARALHARLRAGLAAGERPGPPRDPGSSPRSRPPRPRRRPPAGSR